MKENYTLTQLFQMGLKEPKLKVGTEAYKDGSIGCSWLSAAGVGWKREAGLMKR